MFTVTLTGERMLHIRPFLEAITNSYLLESGCTWEHIPQTDDAEARIVLTVSGNNAAIKWFERVGFRCEFC